LASKWLDRWTKSSFWAPVPKLKKKLESVSAEKGQVKRTARKLPAVKPDDGSSSGSNKQKQRPKKDSNHSLVSAQAQELAKKETEKSSLKKTRMQNVTDRSEIVNEKRKHSSRATSDQTVTDVSEQGPGSSEKIKETAVPKSEESFPEKGVGQKVLEENNDKPKKSSNGGAKEENGLGKKTLEEKNDKPKKSLTGSTKEEKSLGQKTLEENNDKPKKSLNGRTKEEKSLGQKTLEENNDKPKKNLSGGAKEEKGLGQKVQEENNGKPKKSLNGGAKEEKGLRQKALEQGGHNDPTAVLQTSVKKVGDEEIGVSEDLNGGDKITSNNYQRRASLPANFNDQENEIHNTPSPRVPSYMAPTESAKARLRGQGSPRFATDIIDKNSLTRRHSLSSSLNSKSGSFSPRVEKLINLSGRGVARTDKSLSSSRDGTGMHLQFSLFLCTF